jgi:neutral ceramidase
MPPGVATFGHALDAHVAEGYWTRLYCRVFYLERGDKTLVLVPCELAAMSALLQRQVIENLEGLLHPSELMMTAVHTHAGVAHYFGAPQYTGPFSSRHPGYDDALMHDMAKQISDAVKRAWMRRQPAALKWSHRDDFTCFTRNRSIEAFKLNGEAPRANVGLPDLDAIDPDMNILSFHALDDAGKPVGPLGSVSFFAMHPTVVRNTNRLFGGDTAGVVSRFVERRMRQQWAEAGTEPLETDPLHGVVNTNEGDISPIWYRGDIDEAILRGNAVAAYVWNHHPAFDGTEPPARIDRTYLEERAPGLTFEDQGGVYSLCNCAYLGMGTAGGATDHPTSIAPIKLFGTDPPADYTKIECQAPKVPLMWMLSKVMRGFPTTLPLASVRINDTVISFVPAEMTVTAGSHLNKRVLEALEKYDGAPNRAIVAGLANEYIQYVATEKEYQLQAYEGASTIYGPNSARYLANRASLLAKAMFDPDVASTIPNLNEASDIDFKYGPKVERLAETENEPFARETIHSCEMPSAVGTSDAPDVCLYWYDGGPGDVPIRDYLRSNGDHGQGTPHPTWVQLVDELNEPVRACRRSGNGACDPGGFVDDRGIEFRTRIHARVRDRWLWSTRFSPSKALWDDIGSKQVRIRVGSDDAVRSKLFSELKTCEPEQARVCLDDERVRNWRNIIDECAVDDSFPRGRYTMWHREPKGCITP